MQLSRLEGQHLTATTAEWVRLGASAPQTGSSDCTSSVRNGTAVFEGKRDGSDQMSSRGLSCLGRS